MSHDMFYISNLIKQFFCCTPLNIMDSIIPGEYIGYLINTDTQSQILNNTVNSDLIKKYPIKRSYQKAFLKWLLTKIEKEGGEIHDDIYITYCNLISSTSDETIHYQHFLIGNSESDYITVKESTHIISEGTTGLCSWQGAVDLSKWCIENKKVLHEKVVLELGCGVGLTGLCVIRNCCPKEYIFTDCHRTVLERVTENVRFNLLNNRNRIQFKEQSNIDRLKLQLKYNDTDIKVMELKWEDMNKYINENWVIPDIIIAADILYEANSFPALVSGLKALLSFNNRYAIIAGTVRNTDTILQFLHQLDLHNLSFEECNVPEQTICIQSINLPVKILKVFQKK